MLYVSRCVLLRQIKWNHPQLSISFQRRVIGKNCSQPQLTSDDISGGYRCVPKFVDLGGKRHPNKDNFPLSFQKHHIDTYEYITYKLRPTTFVWKFMLSIRFPSVLTVVPSVFNLTRQAFSTLILVYWKFFPSATQANKYFWDIGLSANKRILVIISVPKCHDSDKFALFLDSHMDLDAFFCIDL